MAKNLPKKGARRFVDRALTNPALMSVIPSGGLISAGYGVAKHAFAKSKGSSGKGKTVSPCLKKWFDCVTDPFSQSAQGACIPFGGNVDSNRYMGYVRGDIIIGTNGIGLLILAPSPYNDVNCLWTTDATFAGTDATWVTALNTTATGIVAIKVSNNRFSAGSVLNNAGSQRDMPLQARLVGGGVKVYYTGTELNKSGLMSFYTNPAHQNATYNGNGPASTSSLGSYQETMICPVTREPKEYPLTPLTTTELEYYNFTANAVSTQNGMTAFAYPWAANQVINAMGLYAVPSGLASLTYAGSATSIIIVTGQPKETVHFEYSMHVEAIGDLTEGQRVPADSDPTGVDAMMAALSRLQVDRNSHPHLSTAGILKQQYAKVCASRDARVSL